MTQPNTPVPPLINLSHSIVAGGTFIQHINQHHYTRSGERPGYARLLENVATAALHDSVHVVDPPKCYPNTRVAIIQNAIDWTLGTNKELSGKPILWMKGGAGAGKSAIARSVAERCSDEGLLLGTFFFGAADPTRNHVKSLVATLSYQISIILPEFRDMVTGFIEDDMLIFDRSIRTQFSTLVIRPLSMVLANRPAASTITPQLIIIDGLDECSSIESQRDLLFTLQEVTNTTTHIRFLICSRPESHLNSAFSLPHMVTTLHNIFLDDDYTATEDIRVYLGGKFEQIKEGHVFKHTLPDPWPTPEMVDTLVDKSSGQFIYAATVVKYVDSPRHRPDQRLNAIFKLRPPFKDLPFTELDALYRLIISKAEDVSTVLDILAFPALYGRYPLRDIEAILQLEQGSVEILLADLYTIITIIDGHVGFLHKSLTDFLAEPQRAGDLYQDLSKAPLSHIAGQISFFSTHSVSQRKNHFSNSWFRMGPFKQVLQELENSDNMKADYVSSAILQASRQFATFEFFRPFLTCDHTELQNQTSFMRRHDKHFIQSYFRYLRFIKDVSEATRLVYWEQMRQYCECVLAVLDDNWSSNWNAHFIYMYYHLLHDPRYHLPSKLLFAKIYEDLGDMHLGTFGDTVLYHGAVTLHPCSNDITKIFHDLLGDIKKEAIFAMSASFCLSFLCEEWRASQDAGHTYRIAGHNQRKKREHPWHWRQMVPRPPSVGNRLALITFQELWSSNNICKLTSIRKALRSGILGPWDRYKSIQVTTIHEYLQVQNLQVRNTGQATSIKPGEQPQQWMLYMFLLDLLPYILPLSGRYEPLVTMCRKKCFSSRSQFWPKKSRRARKAITRYLRRMDLQEGGDL
ncbi:hypothetical protein D9613_010726 [Agrocybe pediades]|uniref:Nephrocystin 3-like N-terminal domain-containing protein n=1 Tax=Agrocybe pediades TaxID=84607 RepID=A0A8H4VKK2_9AGAR|nr:hypothetical protein D9613_010726 [Agrocybe pediades]